MYAVQKITNDYMQANGQLKVNLEIRYGKKNLEELVRELETSKWVKINAQHCPGCKAIIQKSMGCNHMICLRCATNFCYLCGNAISSTEPYQHLNNKECLQDT